MVDLTGSPVPDVDFGFSANVITNVNDSGQGSLRQFITNSNAIAGANTMKFVPSVPKNSANWWRITLASVLPNIADSLTTINGIAYYFDGAIRDANGGSVGSGGMSLETGSDGVVGTSDEPILTAFNKKELEIDINHNAFYGLNVSQNGISNITIKNIAIFGSKDKMATSDESSDILVSDGANNIDISYNFVGLRADGSTPSTKQSLMVSR